MLLPRQIVIGSLADDVSVEVTEGVLVLPDPIRLLLRLARFQVGFPAKTTELKTRGK